MENTQPKVKSVQVEKQILFSIKKRLDILIFITVMTNLDSTAGIGILIPILFWKIKSIF
jgi:hypothetical protein